MDFTDLNQACPKYHYPLPRIDQLVDRAFRHQKLSFIYEFFGYTKS